MRNGSLSDARGSESCDRNDDRGRYRKKQEASCSSSEESVRQHEPQWREARVARAIKSEKNEPGEQRAGTSQPTNVAITAAGGRHRPFLFSVWFFAPVVRSRRATCPSSPLVAQAAFVY